MPYYYLLTTYYYPLKPREIEFEINGIYHAACYTLNRNGTLYIEDLVRDNGDGACEPCELTHAINYQLHKLLSDEIEEAKNTFNYQKQAHRRRCVLGY